MSWLPPYPVETARLLLRPHRMTDLDDLVGFHGDPEVTRYIPWPVRDRRQTEEALAAKLAQDRAERDGDWIVLAMQRRDTGTVIGEVLLKREDAEHGVAELGYAMSRAHQGQGLASEAAAAMIALAAGFGVRTVVAHIDRHNAASIALATRLGLRRARDLADGLVEYALRLPPAAPTPQQM